jgi:UDP-3-O-[3-hydroxymyristoyl] glucosamine N-acyltransferase
MNDVPAGGRWFGYPARPHREAMRASAAFFRLPALMRELEAIVAERLAARRDARSLAEGAGE